nr:hypothetical protein [Tanacetum cinerariifolium]
MDQQWHQSQMNDQRDDKGSWIKRKLNNIRLKKLHDINNKIEILESQQRNRNKEEFKARRLMNVRCYKCKEKGHFVNNCPVWKKMRKAQIVEEEDKESIAENHKHTIRKLKPREPYNQVYQERIMISGDYLVLGTENSFWDDFWMQNKYTKGMGTFENQAKGFADHFCTTVVGMDVANKHVSNNKAIKKIKKEDDNFVII